MKKDVEEYVKKCAKYQLNKTLRLKRKVPMAITTTTLWKTCTRHNWSSDGRGVGE